MELSTALSLNCQHLYNIVKFVFFISDIHGVGYKAILEITCTAEHLLLKFGFYYFKIKFSDLN